MTNDELKFKKMHDEHVDKFILSVINDAAPSCANCKHWKDDSAKISVRADGKSGEESVIINWRGECRLNPPEASRDYDSLGQISNFPSTEYNKPCSQHDMKQ